MVSRRVCVILKRVSERSETVIADILQIVLRLFSVGKIQASLFEPVNLFLNGEWFLCVLHNSRFFIKTRRPPWCAGRTGSVGGHIGGKDTLFLISKHCSIIFYFLPRVRNARNVLTGAGSGYSVVDVDVGALNLETVFCFLHR